MPKNDAVEADFIYTRSGVCTTSPLNCGTGVRGGGRLCLWSHAIREAESLGTSLSFHSDRTPLIKINAGQWGRKYRPDDTLLKTIVLRSRDRAIAL